MTAGDWKLIWILIACSALGYCLAEFLSSLFRILFLEIDIKMKQGEIRRLEEELKKKKEGSDGNG